MIFEARKCVLGLHERRRHAEFARPFYCIHIVSIKSFAQTPSAISDIVSSTELFFSLCHTHIIVGVSVNFAIFFVINSITFWVP